MFFIRRSTKLRFMRHTALKLNYSVGNGNLAPKVAKIRKDESLSGVMHIILPK